MFSIFMQLEILNAQPGTPDMSFGDNGHVLTLISLGSKSYTSALQSDGKIIAAGMAINNGPGGGFEYDWALARYNTDGTLDSTFAYGGLIVPVKYGLPNSIGISTDGKIIVAGHTNDNFLPAIAKFNENGSFDTSFANGDLLLPDNIEFLTTIELQTDNKLIVLGVTIDSMQISINKLIRYNVNGSIDSTFGTNGIVIINFDNESSWYGTLAEQPDGRILVGGQVYNGINNYDFAVARFNSNGTIDSTFNDIGIVISDINHTDNLVKSIIVQADEKIEFTGINFDGVLHGYAMARYNIDGSLDVNFGDNGFVITPENSILSYTWDIVVQSDGRMFVAGGATNGNGQDFALLCYNSDGFLDTTFASTGIAINNAGALDGEATSIILQPDGKVLAIGYIGDKFALVRYFTSLNTAIPDLAIEQNSLFFYPNPIAQNGVVQYFLQRTQEVSIDLIDMQGKVVYSLMSHEIQLKGKHELTVIFPEMLEPGMYLISVSSKSGDDSIIKIIKD